MSDVTEKLERALAASRVPTHMHESLLDYLLKGHPVGSFLTAVLENDLHTAVKKADLVNRAALAEYIIFLVHYAPAESWGHEGVTEEWRRVGGLLEGAGS